MPNNMNKLTISNVPTAREAEVFLSKTLSMEIWWNDTDRGKASTGKKVSWCHLVHPSPTWTYLTPIFLFQQPDINVKRCGGGAVNTVTKTKTNVIYCAGFESLGEKES